MPKQSSSPVSWMHRKERRNGSAKKRLSLQNVRLLPNAQNTVSFAIRAGEIVGIAGVEGNGQQQLEEMITQLGIGSCVRLLGRRGDVDRLYQAFDVYLLPSFTEGNRHIRVFGPVESQNPLQFGHFLILVPF